MAQRRFGPTLDAGVVIIEKDSEKAITASALGSTAYVAVLERGPVGELIATSGKKDAIRKTGGLIDESVGPDCVQDFWDHGEGAGLLFLLRVTAGDEQAAQLQLYDRQTTRAKSMLIAAKNGGSWGGKRQTWVVDMADPDPAGGSDVTGDTTIQLPVAFQARKDQFKGGTVTISEIGKTYNIASNTESLDAISSVVLTLTGESKAQTQYDAIASTPFDAELVIKLDNADVFGRDKHLAALVKNGQQNPTTEFGLEIYLDNELVLTYPDLSVDKNAANYFVNTINKDGANHYITVTDNIVGVATADNRPANFFASVAAAKFAAKTVDLSDYVVLVDSSAASDNTIDTFTWGAEAIPDTYEVELTAPTAWQMISLLQQATHTFATPNDGSATTPDNAQSPGFTATAVTGIAGEKFTLTALPFRVDEAINGRIFMENQSFAPSAGFLISDNDAKSATIANGDMTNGGTLAGSVSTRLEYKQEFQHGYDGIANIAQDDFTQHWNTSLSKFGQLSGKGYGLVKFATPGITNFTAGALSLPADAVAVEKAGVSYAEATNHQYRYEIKKSIVDEFLAKTEIQDTYGKNTFAKVIFPGWCSVSDPIRSGRLKSIPTTGMVHGREAREARNYDGYHKASAGLTLTLPRIVELPTGKESINGEILNPAGIQYIATKGGNFVIWGDRIPTTDSSFVYAHHREMMSYYEHVLEESFDYIIFAINDKQEQPGLVATIKKFFLPEWRTKRALRGDTFDAAASIKIDAENNTDATRALGQMHADIVLRLADTIEQFIISISKAGIFEGTA